MHRNKFSTLRYEEKNRKKKLIADAAVQMFFEKPFSQVTMRGIAEAVGITPAAIYSYFPDKNDLFSEAYIACGDMFIKEVSELMTRCDGFCIRDVAVKYIGFFYCSRSGRPFNFILQFMLNESIDTGSWEKINTTNRRFTALVEEFLRRFNQNSKADLKLLAQSFIAALNGILLTSKNYPKKTESEILEHMKAHAVTIAEMFQEKMMLQRHTSRGI